MQKIYIFHFKPINYKKKKKKEVCWLCTTFNPVIRVSFIILEPYSHRSLCSTVLHIEKRPAAFMWAQHTVPHPQSPTAELHTQLNAAFCFSECCTVPALSHRAVFFHYMLLMAQYGSGTVKVCWHSSLICLTPAHFQTLLGGFAGAAATRASDLHYKLRS